MSARYVSTKQDGYQATRNNVYLERGKKQIASTYKAASACRNLPEQSKANYGITDYK